MTAAETTAESAAATAAADASRLDEADLAALRRALVRAHEAIGVSDPNPRVGCVIAAPDGRVLGEGATQRAGGPHAEVVALEAARAAGTGLAGATAWVTLEPCAHHGRTPPCCDALVAAGIGRVVVALRDPFPAVNGRGIERLRAAGVRVDVLGEAACDAADEAAALAEAVREINIGFLSRVRRGRPWVRLKMAASLDGLTALPDGRSQWITGPAARADGHAWRRRAGAVLSGIGTVLADDPRLDVREVPSVLQPLRVIADPTLRLPASARLLAPPGAVLVVAARAVDAADAADASRHADGAKVASDADAAGIRRRAEALRAAGAEVIGLGDAAGRVDLAALLRLLADRGINELHVEAGATLNAALLDAGLVDELLVYLAPCLLGQGRGLTASAAPPALEAVARWHWHDTARIGADLRLRLLKSPAAAAFDL